jgi:hypothetical protein
LTVKRKFCEAETLFTFSARVFAHLAFFPLSQHKCNISIVSANNNNHRHRHQHNHNASMVFSLTLCIYPFLALMNIRAECHAVLRHFTIQLLRHSVLCVHCQDEKQNMHRFLANEKPSDIHFIRRAHCIVNSEASHNQNVFRMLKKFDLRFVGFYGSPHLIEWIVLCNNSSWTKNANHKLWIINIHEWSIYSIWERESPGSLCVQKRCAWCYQRFCLNIILAFNKFTFACFAWTLP